MFRLVTGSFKKKVWTIMGKKLVSLCCIFLLGQISIAQDSTATLPSDVVATLQKQNDAFLKTASDAAPAMKRRMARQELRLTHLLEQLSDAEKNKNAALAAKLADELGSVDADVIRLHTAQSDLAEMRSITQVMGANLSESNPKGEVCQGGKCADVPAVEAILIILTAGLADELNKKEPFGPNNEIMKALHSIGGFIQCIFGCK
jgi:hypothetical protein